MSNDHVCDVLFNWTHCGYLTVNKLLFNCYSQLNLIIILLLTALIDCPFSCVKHLWIFLQYSCYISELLLLYCIKTITELYYCIFCFQMHPNVICVNLVLSALTVFHLSYLGLMFDSSPSEDRVSHQQGRGGESLVSCYVW